MNDDLLTPVVDLSNSALNITDIHRRRHRHQELLNVSSDSLRGKYPNADSKSAEVSDKSSSLYEYPQKNPVSLHNSGPFSEFLDAPHSKLFSGLSSNTTTGIPSPDFYVRIPHNNRTLTFHRDIRNSSTRSNNALNKGSNPQLHNYYDISSYGDDNSANASEYQQNEITPFNTDEESLVPHFDAEFFPEPLTPLFSDHNRTASILSGNTLDPFSFTPWGPPPENVGNSHQTHFINNTNGAFNHNSLFNKNTTNFIFTQHGILPDYDYSLNLSAVLDGGFNTSTSGHNSSSTDDLYTWSILIMAPLVIFGVTGNTLVILAISLEKRLQNVTNYFLLSLAVTDLLVSLIVMPFSIINVLTGRWLFGLLLCDFFVTSDVLMCTSSILHLCTISLERYIGIRYPLWTKNKSKRIVLLKIVLVWTISLAISSPITILGVVKEDNVLVGGACVLNNEYFIIYGSIFAFYIPLAIMVLMYGLTVRMLNKQARLCHSRPAEDGEGQPMIRRSTSRRHWHTRNKFYCRETLSSTSYCGAGLMDGGITGVMAPFHQRYRSTGVKRHNTIPVCYHHHNHRHHKEAGGGGVGSCSAGGSNKSINIQRRGSFKNAATVNNNSTNNNCITDSSNSTSHNSTSGRRNRYVTQNGMDSNIYLGINQTPEFSYCNGRQEEITTDTQSDSQNCCTTSSSSSPSPTSSANRQPKRLRDLVRKHHVAVKAANILLMKTQNQGQTSGLSSSNSASVRRDNSVRTEQKASKVLGVVFMIFVVCWAPFFTVNILTALCTSCRFEPTLITAFVWLGYVSSTLNPIIYTIFNNIFRNTFIKLLCCRYRLLHRAKRNNTLPGIRNGLLNCTTFCPAPLVAASAANFTSTTFLEESQC